VRDKRLTSRSSPGIFLDPRGSGLARDEFNAKRRKRKGRGGEERRGEDKIRSESFA